jgi:hypothetical protein
MVPLIPPPPYYDTNGDNQLKPSDALMVINALNSKSAAYQPKLLSAEKVDLQLALGEGQGDVPSAWATLIAESSGSMLSAEIVGPAESPVRVKGLASLPVSFHRFLIEAEHFRMTLHSDRALDEIGILGHELDIDHPVEQALAPIRRLVVARSGAQR